MTDSAFQQHYTAQLAEAASLYENDPSAESAWSLVQALALGRLFGAERTVYSSVLSAIQPHAGDILEAALDDALTQDFAASVDEFAEHADHAVEEWEDQAQDIRILLFELQASHDWLADQILDSAALLPRLVKRLNRLSSSASLLRARVLAHRDLFHVAEDLERHLLSAADPAYITDAYNVLTSVAGASAIPFPGRSTTRPASSSGLLQAAGGPARKGAVYVVLSARKEKDGLTVDEYAAALREAGYPDPSQPPSLSSAEEAEALVTRLQKTLPGSHWTIAEQEA